MEDAMTREPQILLTQRTVMVMIGIGSRETLARWMRRGQFPRPIKVGGGGLRWLPSDIETWLRTCAIQRDQRSQVMSSTGRTVAKAFGARRGKRHG